MKPNFFIVGGPKCGTTNISHYLNLHPQVFISELNEPYYFCKFDVPENFERDSMIRDMDTYLKLFKKAKNHKAIGEATSAYLSCPHAASEIKKAFPESKIIISLRNPIERAHSAYFSYLFMHPQETSFTDMINLHHDEIMSGKFNIRNILLGGFYTEQIKRFQNHFDAKKIRIVIFEEYIKNIESTITSILRFLDVDGSIEFSEQEKGSYRVPKGALSGFLLSSKLFRKTTTKLIPTVTRQKIGDGFFLKQTTKPPMSTKERMILREIYEQEVKNLKLFLERDLPWDDFN
jgi:hypothetical protein